MNSVRVRFAPSPTGPLHIGGARSALFNWLFARRYGGTFIVRIEDTDLERSSPKAEENILEALRWLGLDWDEGVDVGGPYGPYRQTDRLEIYRRYANLLVEKGCAYPCYCTEDELAAQREELLRSGEQVKYGGRCRGLTPAERARLEALGRKPALRFAVPEDKTVTVRDLVRGDVCFDCSGIGDFIILKSDGIPTYNFAVVVDDHEMKISHVIRAEEHLPNTPRQILLYEAFGWELPAFAHVSLILGKDRSKMSKRHGATAVIQYRERGYLPEALVNFLALLGWSPGGEEEVISVEELKRSFSLDRVSKSPAVFDLDKLNWLNGHYIRATSVERLAALAVPFLQKAGCVGDPPSALEQEWVKAVVELARDYVCCLEEIPEYAEKYLGDGYDFSEEAKEVLSRDKVSGLLEALAEEVGRAECLTAQNAPLVLKAAGQKAGLKGKDVFVPVRAALTGSTQGPDLPKVMAVIGREGVLRRLKRASALVGG